MIFYQAMILKISLVDGRPEIINDVSEAPEQLKQYLIQELSALINNSGFLQALPGHLNYSDETEVREGIVLDRIQDIIK